MYTKFMDQKFLNFINFSQHRGKYSTRHSLWSTLYIENYTLLRFKDDKKINRKNILYYNINEFIQDRTQVPQYSKTTMLKNRITIKPQYSYSASSRNLRLLERLLPFPFFFRYFLSPKNMFAVKIISKSNIEIIAYIFRIFELILGYGSIPFSPTLWKRFLFPEKDNCF